VFALGYWNVDPTQIAFDRDTTKTYNLLQVKDRSFFFRVTRTYNGLFVSTNKQKKHSSDSWHYYLEYEAQNAVKSVKQLLNLSGFSSTEKGSSLQLFN